MSGFSHITDWVFDLDNTLYPAECQLFAQIDKRMTDYVAQVLSVDLAEARRVQKQLYVDHGTTLAGLMINHKVEPEHFMDFVHDIDVSGVATNTRLAQMITALPGRRFVFTNGSVRHAENVMGKLGLSECFDGIFDVTAAGYIPKPHAQAYERFLKAYDIEPTNAAMFEDLAVNLEVPGELGMTTVLVCSESGWIADEPSAKRPAHPNDHAPHVDHRTTDLTEFLSTVKTSSCLLYTSPSPRDLSTSRMPSSA